MTLYMNFIYFFLKFNSSVQSFPILLIVNCSNAKDKRTCNKKIFNTIFYIKCLLRNKVEQILIRSFTKFFLYYTKKEKYL